VEARQFVKGRRAEPEDPGTDLAFHGAAAWIVAALVACAFVAWYPGRTTGRAPVELTAPTEALRAASFLFRDQWLPVWPAAAMLLGATVAPVVFLRARGVRVAKVYVVLAGLALLMIPATWWLCRPW
jgi:hypothetical protein